MAIVLGLWLAQRPPDLSHPQGHSRYEPLAGLVVAAAMTFAAYEAGQTSIQRLIEGGAELSLGWPTAALLLSAMVKAGMFALIHRIAALTRSSTLDANRKGQSRRRSHLPAAFLGILGSKLIHPWADECGRHTGGTGDLSRRLVVAGDLNYLTGGGAQRVADRDRGCGTGRSWRQSVHQVLTRAVAPDLVADLPINVDGTMPLSRAHAISDEVRARVEELPGIDRAYVHAEPFEAVPRRGASA